MINLDSAAIRLIVLQKKIRYGCFSASTWPFKQILSVFFNEKRKIALNRSDSLKSCDCLTLFCIFCIIFFIFAPSIEILCMKTGERIVYEEKINCTGSHLSGCFLDFFAGIGVYKIDSARFHRLHWHNREILG